MSSGESNSHVVRSVRLHGKELTDLLDSLDGAGQSGNAQDRRAHKRFRFRRERCIIHIQQPGDACDMAFLCPTRDISAEGLSFLHGGYVHLGSCVAIHFGRDGSAWDGVCGRVVRCRYAGSGLYEVGVLFNNPIRPGTVVKPKVARRVLLAEDDATLAQLEVHLLRQLNAIVDHAPDGKVAVDLATRAPYDVILMDMNMPGMTGYEATAALRKNGYHGPIIAVSAIEDPEQIQRCLDSGCDRHLQKPFTQADLAAILESVSAAPNGEHSASAPSAPRAPEALGDAIATVLAALPARVAAVDAAAKASDAAALEQLVTELRADMEHRGLTDVANSAARIEAAVVAKQSMESIQSSIAELTQLCLSLRPAGES